MQNTASTPVQDRRCRPAGEVRELPHIMVSLIKCLRRRWYDSDSLGMYTVERY